LDKCIMLKRKKPIGKCINLMAKAGIFIKSSLWVKGGRGDTICRPDSSIVLPICKSSER
jgi:hypothetical protein